jgi:molybdate transport system permease protein
MERSTPAPRAAATPRRPPSRTTIGLLLASIPMLAFLLIPILALILRADPGALAANLASEEVGQAIRLSLVTTAASTALGLLLGTPLAYLLARRRFRGHGVLDTLVDLPMVLPPSVAGIALLIAFGRRGLIGGWLDEAGISIAFTTLAVVLAQTFVAAPFYIKTAIAGFEGVDRDLEQAAAVDGAGPGQVFARITVPLCWPVLLGGLVMSWARALGEFGATIIFAGNFPGRTQTMPLAIYIGFELDLGLALTLAIILLCVSSLVLFLVKWALRQRVTAPR